MKLRWILIFILSVLLGGLMHFFYDWLPIPIVGLFAPVNESVWEHLKLLYWPFLVGCCLLQDAQEDRQRFWGAALAANLVMPLALTGGYYLLHCGFLVSALAVDLGLYAASLALGFVLTARWSRLEGAKSLLGILILLSALYAACLILFSVAAPQLPIFTPQMH